MQNIGRGLRSLIPAKSAGSDEEYIAKQTEPFRVKKESVFDIEINKIVPNPMQPRLEMDKEELSGLAESIKEHGILQPLIVTKSTKDVDKGQDVEYTLIAGHRRWQAARMLGLKHVPAIIRDTTEQQKLELALVENIQRTDLPALDRARAFKRLSEEFDLTHQEIAQRVGKSREVITNTIRLLNLPQDIQDGLAAGKISDGHARTIVGVKSPQAQRALYDEILKNNLNVRQVEQRVREVAVASHYRKVFLDPEIKKIAGQLTAHLGYKTEIKKAGLGGRVMISFSEKEDLGKIARKIINK